MKIDIEFFKAYLKAMGCIFACSFIGIGIGTIAIEYPKFILVSLFLLWAFILACAMKAGK